MELRHRVQMALVEDIMAGRHDDELEELFRAIKSRGKSLAQEADSRSIAEFVKGDRVVLVSVSPKFMQGQTGRVVALTEKGLIEVELDDPTGYRGRRTVNCRPSSLKRLAG